MAVTIIITILPHLEYHIQNEKFVMTIHLQFESKTQKRENLEFKSISFSFDSTVCGTARFDV